MDCLEDDVGAIHLQKVDSALLAAARDDGDVIARRATAGRPTKQSPDDEWGDCFPSTSLRAGCFARNDSSDLGIFPAKPRQSGHETGSDLFDVIRAAKHYMF